MSVGASGLSGWCVTWLSRNSTETRPQHGLPAQSRSGYLHQEPSGGFWDPAESRRRNLRRRLQGQRLPRPVWNPPWTAQRSFSWSWSILTYNYRASWNSCQEAVCWMQMCCCKISRCVNPCMVSSDHLTGGGAGGGVLQAHTTNSTGASQQTFFCWSQILLKRKETLTDFFFSSVVYNNPHLCAGILEEVVWQRSECTCVNMWGFF